MNVLVVGLGSIGCRHVNVIKGILPKARIAALREFSKSTDPADVGDLLEAVFISRAQALAFKPQIVIVANPAPFHVSTALEFTQAGADVFIEKPLSVDLEGIEALEEECIKNKRIAMVGYVLRFSRPVRLMKEAIEAGKIGRILSFDAHVGKHLPSWRGDQDFHRNVTARADLGGGVLLELSHELDYARYLVAEAVSIGAFTGQIADFGIDVEDIAQINIRFANKALGHVHLDMFDRASHRGCRIIGSEGTLVWDMTVHGEHSVKLWHAASKTWTDLLKPTMIEPNEMYTTQMNYFLECVDKRQDPMINIAEGKRTLVMILAAKVSALSGKAVDL